MKRLVLLMVVLALLLAACNSASVENSSEPITESSEASVAPSDESSERPNEDESSNEVEKLPPPESLGESSDVSDTPEEPFKESVVAEKGIQNIPFTQEEIMYPNIVYDTGTYDSDLQYYSRFGDNVYVTIFINNTDGKGHSEGTQKYTNGKPTTFYPNVCKVIEYKGQAYGVYRTFGAYIDARRYYAKLNDDGSCDILFECWDVTYVNEKVYYSKYNEELVERQLISVNPDGSGATVVYSGDEFNCYINEAMVYEGLPIFDRYETGCVLKDGENETVILEDGYKLNFINNGYIYYMQTDETYENNWESVKSLFRRSIGGGEPEKLLTIQIDSWICPCTIFANKLFVFLSDNIYVYDSDFSKPKILNYGSFSLKNIEQISVTEEELTVLLYLGDGQGNVFRKTLVYNTEGELIFE